MSLSTNVYSVFTNPPTPQEIQAFWEKYDEDGNGEIDGQEAELLVKDISDTLSQRYLDKMKAEMRDLQLTPEETKEKLATYV